jgi:hypothetical protein
MAIPPNKKPGAARSATGKLPAKAPPPTRRGAPAPASGRARAPAAPPKNNLPLFIGIGVGAVLLIVVLIVALSGGEDPKAERTARKESKPETAAKAPPPDVSGLEATGKQKCDEGQRLIQPRLNPDPSAPKDRVFNDLENGLKVMNEGLEAYKKATDIAGKKYPLDSYRKLRDQAIRVFCTELESEGQKSCEAGLKIVKASQSQIVDTNALSDDDKAKLVTELRKAQDFLRGGMGMFERSRGVSDHQFDVTQYQEALKVIRPKIAELK